MWWGVTLAPASKSILAGCNVGLACKGCFDALDIGGIQLYQSVEKPCVRAAIRNIFAYKCPSLINTYIRLGVYSKAVACICPNMYTADRNIPSPHLLALPCLLVMLAACLNFLYIILYIASNAFI
jgi:hypothetical protein